MHFTKMQGLGNDYLYVYGKVPENIRALSRALSDRHFGAGSDGMIYISGSDKADFSMRIFNADGSEAKMCGNGIRCVGKYVYDKGYTKNKHLKIETLSGIKELWLHVSEGAVETVTVNMGAVKTEEKKTLYIMGRKLEYTPVSVGNPHAVVFVDDAEDVPVCEIGAEIENSGAFPDGVNVEFVSLRPDGTLRMRVRERGSGLTMACGTGACASVAAALKKGIIKPFSQVSVMLDGGRLEILLNEKGEAIMTGPAVTVYEGECQEEKVNAYT